MSYTVTSMDYSAMSTILMFAVCETRSCVNLTVLKHVSDEVTLGRSAGLNGRITLDPMEGFIERISKLHCC